LGWEPLLSLRPPKHQDIDNLIILRLSPFFGCGPSLFVFLGFAFDHLRPLTVSHLITLILMGCALILFGFVGFFVLYKLTFAFFWNRRARRLRNSQHEHKAVA
jgi:hypothetical protein